MCGTADCFDYESLALEFADDPCLCKLTRILPTSPGSSVVLWQARTAFRDSGGWILRGIGGYRGDETRAVFRLEQASSLGVECDAPKLELPSTSVIYSFPAAYIGPKNSFYRFDCPPFREILVKRIVTVYRTPVFVVSMFDNRDWIDTSHRSSVTFVLP